jgi:predicted TIM-barrel fold metal-dependent hydrolase
MHVFDAHTHFFSRAFYEYQARKAPAGDVPFLLEKMARSGIDVPGEGIEAHRDRIISDLDDNGIDRAVTFASVPDEMEIVGQAARSSDGRLVPYAAVNPMVPETLERFELLHSRYDYKGLILFPQAHDYAVGGEDAASAFDLAGRLGVVTLVHCGLLSVPVRSIVGLESDFSLDRGHPEDLIPVAKARPDQVFVVPHFGAGFFAEFLKLGGTCPNVYTDTSGSNSWGMFQVPPLYLEDLFEQTVGVFGIERVLYGSDTAGFPRGYRNDVRDAQIRAMHDAGIGAGDQELILGGNLAKLLEA